MSRTHRAFDIAKKMAAKGRELRPAVFEENRFHGYDAIKAMCREARVRVVENEDLPAAYPQAAVMDVEGECFIVIGRSLSCCAIFS